MVKIQKVFVGDRQVLPLGFVPGENTLLYFPVTSSDTSSTVIDRSNNGNNATWVGTAQYETLSTGKRVLNFTGSQGIYCETKVLSSQPFTVMFWVYDSGSQSIDNTLLSNQKDTGLNGFVISFKSGTDWFTFYGNGSALQTTTNTVSLGTLERKHYAVTVDSNVIRKYVNGVLVQTVNGSGSPVFTNATNLSIGFLRTDGSNRTNFRYVNAKMADIIIEDKKWLDDDILANYNLSKQFYPTN